MLLPTRKKLAIFRPTRLDIVWRKPFRFEKTQPSENLTDCSPLYFEQIKESCGVSNISTKKKRFQLYSTHLTIRKTFIFREMNQSALKIGIGVIDQCGNGATFQNKAETARLSILRRRRSAFLDQGGDGAAFLTHISMPAFTFVGSQNWPYSMCNQKCIMKL